jgi:hypothetical protein
LAPHAYPNMKFQKEVFAEGEAALH